MKHKKAFNVVICLVACALFLLVFTKVRADAATYEITNFEELVQAAEISRQSGHQNDTFLLSNSKFIMEGLRKMNEKLTFTELEIYNNIGTDLVINFPLKPLQTNNEEGGNSQPQTQGNNVETEGSMGNNSTEIAPKGKIYSLDDIIEAFSNYMTLGPPNVLNYKA